MPLFRRPDGELLKDLGLLRRILPHIMPTRTESLVLYEQVLDLTQTLPFIDRYNQTHDHPITLFHVVVYAIARGLFARPGLNRFVIGSRIYQRREVSISFTLKREHADDAPVVTAKIYVKPDDSFDAMVERIYEAVHRSRHDDNRAIDKELKLLFRLPHRLLRLTIAAIRWLDAHNLLPASFIRSDPMYSTIMVANLGSIGIDRVWHHLYEYGTIGFFCSIGQASKTVVPGPNDEPVVRSCLRLRFSFDERVNDGFYCIDGLNVVKDLVEHPEALAAPANRTASVKVGKGRAGTKDAQCSMSE